MQEISKEYAQALFALGCECAEESALMQSLSYPDYMELLASPALTMSERQGALARVLEDRPEHVRSFLMLLCEKGHIRDFAECVKEYERLLEMRMSHVTARVCSAAELSEGQKQSLKDKLERTSHAHVTLECTVDPSLLGGVIVEMDGRVMDGSLRRRLQEIKEVISDESKT